MSVHAHLPGRTIPLAVPAGRISPDSARIAQLEAENERLQCKVESLEQALYGVDRMPLPDGLTRRARIVARLLLRQSVVTTEQVLAALEAEIPTVDGRDLCVLHVLISRELRPLLSRYGVTVNSKRFVGYWITSEHKALMRACFGSTSGASA